MMTADERSRTKRRNELREYAAQIIGELYSPEDDMTVQLAVRLIARDEKISELARTARNLEEACAYALDAMSRPDGPPHTAAEQMAIKKLQAAIGKARGES